MKAIVLFNCDGQPFKVLGIFATQEEAEHWIGLYAKVFPPPVVVPFVVPQRPHRQEGFLPRATEHVERGEDR